jgi:hypothetical protein
MLCRSTSEYGTNALKADDNAAAAEAAAAGGKPGYCGDRYYKYAPYQSTVNRLQSTVNCLIGSRRPGYCGDRYYKYAPYQSTVNRLQSTVNSQLSTVL